jgi:hypothetical protein
MAWSLAKSPARSACPLILILLGLLALLASGCSDSSGPKPSDSQQGAAMLGGELDPGTGTFVLKTLTEPPPGGLEPVRVALIGSNLQIDGEGELVSLDVALRNLGEEPLYGPAMVWLNGFYPQTVTVTNADDQILPVDIMGDHPDGGVGFNYTGLLGGDNVLDPQETSGTKTWIFHVPGLVSFSFGAQAVFSLVPDLPRIAGGIWHDLNLDGIHTRNEPFYPYPCHLAVTGPDNEVRQVQAGSQGAFSFVVTQPGLYSLRLFADTPGPVAPIYTTPNPLEVLLTADADGQPVSYLTAMFGVGLPGPGGPYPPVILLNAPPDSLYMAPWEFVGGHLEDSLIVLNVGYSGCQPDHPFALFMVGGFMESEPVQARLLLQHDDLGEMCDAHFLKRIVFDLNPVRRAFHQAYGAEHGIVRLMLEDFGGATHEFVYTF